MKKSHIWTILICIVISIAAAFFIRHRKIKKTNLDRSTCIINIRNVQQAVRGYTGMASSPRTTEQMWHDIFYSEDAFLKLPKCPSGGTYTFHKPEHMYQPPGFLYCTCSHAETLNHKPEGTDDW